MSPEQSHSEHYAASGGGLAASAPGAASPATGPRPVDRRQVALIAAVLVIGLLVVGVMALVSEVRDEALSDLTKDPTAVKGLDFETGILTRIEVIVWLGAAAAALTAAFVAQRLDRPEALILFGFGLLGLVMAADDSLTVHEAVANVTGMPLVELGYLVALVWLLWRLRRPILTGTPWLVLGAAWVGMGMSEAVDLLDDHVGLNAGAALEDVFKFLGILLFSTYLLLVTRSVVERVGPGSRPGETA